MSVSVALSLLLSSASCECAFIAKVVMIWALNLDEEGHAVKIKELDVIAPAIQMRLRWRLESGFTLISLVCLLFGVTKFFSSWRLYRSYSGLSQVNSKRFIEPMSAKNSSTKLFQQNVFLFQSFPHFDLCFEIMQSSVSLCCHSHPVVFITHRMPLYFPAIMELGWCRWLCEKSISKWN